MRPGMDKLKTLGIGFILFGFFALAGCVNPSPIAVNSVHGGDIAPGARAYAPGGKIYATLTREGFIDIRENREKGKLIHRFIIDPSNKLKAICWGPDDLLSITYHRNNMTKITTVSLKTKSILAENYTRGYCHAVYLDQDKNLIAFDKKGNRRVINLNYLKRKE